MPKAVQVRPLFFILLKQNNPMVQYSAKGKKLAYRLTGKDKMKFEVNIAEQGAQISGIQATVQDLKLKTDKISDKQDMIAEKQSAFFLQVNNWMVQSGSEVAKIKGTPDCPGIITRLDATEHDVLAIKTGFKFVYIGVPLLIAAIDLIFKFWKP